MTLRNYYNKTALKKNKKQELVDLCLDLQAQLLDRIIDGDGTREYREKIVQLEEENKKLKQDNDDLKAYQDVEAEIIKDHSEIGSITEVNDFIKKLKEDLQEKEDDLGIMQNDLNENDYEIGLLEEENKKLKEQLDEQPVDV